MQTQTINIQDVKTATLGNFYDHGILELSVKDEQFRDNYKLLIQDTNKGLSVRCFLNHQISYQADGFYGKSTQLRTVINKIAGGEVIKQNGETI
ncbi:MAG: hypothetical protein KKG73_08855 [Gammaproteobacteria bacterium]|nr:hypothetical protein [Gammaproteobacteria bacterium]